MKVVPMQLLMSEQAHALSAVTLQYAGDHRLPGPPETDEGTHDWYQDAS